VSLVGDASEQPAVADAPSQRPCFREGDKSMNPERNCGSPGKPATADDVLDPLVEAEMLRAMLNEVARRVNRLLVLLRQFHKHRPALQSAWTSLQQLHLGPKERA
jgi:hypothetical protein